MIPRVPRAVRIELTLFGRMIYHKSVFEADEILESDGKIIVARNLSPAKVAEDVFILRSRVKKIIVRLLMIPHDKHDECDDEHVHNDGADGDSGPTPPIQPTEQNPNPEVDLLPGDDDDNLDDLSPREAKFQARWRVAYR